MSRLLCIVVLLSLPAVAAGTQLRTIDLREMECQIVSIGDGVVSVTTEAGAKELPVSDVEGIYVAFTTSSSSTKVGAMDRRGRRVLVTAGGDVLAIALQKVDDGAFVFDNVLIGECSVEMAKVAAMYSPTGEQTSGDVHVSCEEMGLDAGTSDRLLVSAEEGGYLPVTGALRTIKDEPVVEGASKHIPVVTFAWQGEDRKVPLSQVRAVLLANGGEALAQPVGYVTSSQGTRIGFTSIELNESAVSIQSPSLGELELNRRHIVSIRFVSARVTNLADVEPTAVTCYGKVIDAMEYRTNMSVGGKPISLDGVTYATGLGLHSFTELTYELDGGYGSFVAMVGIDDIARPGGDATLTIEQTGPTARPPVTLRLTGETPAEIVRVDISGATALTIRVDFGADELGVGDHVDVASARLIAARPATQDEPAPEAESAGMD